MSSIDALSKIVLNNIKIPTENAGQLIPFLRQIKPSYGNPIALVHDMGGAILSAVKEVFPGLADYICHFHFLKDIGKDLFGDDYRTTHRHLKTLRIRSDLRNIAKGLKKAIDSNPDSLQCLHCYLKSKRLLKPQTRPTPLMKAYLIICWILEARNESNGLGFPFDRAHFDFYRRLQEAYPDLLELKKEMAADASLLLLAPMRSVHCSAPPAQARENRVWLPGSHDVHAPSKRRAECCPPIWRSYLISARGPSRFSFRTSGSGAL
jgi:hypothetical protein